MFKSRSGQRLVLGSSSPRRRELLAACGLQFEIASPDIDESVLTDEKPQVLVERLAQQKGDNIAALHPDAWVIAADTVVAIDDQILGKPTDVKEAETMLHTIQGRWHTVWGGVAILNLSQRKQSVFTYSSRVLMRALDSMEIRAYVATSEPMDKAGSYAIQGIGAALVAEVQGSYSNVVGLNISEVIRELVRCQAVEVAV